MKHLSTQRLLAFSDQLSKEADLKSTLGGFGARALLGAGAGAIAGGATAPEGEGLKRGIRGALLGGALGAGSKLLSQAGRQEAKSGLSNFAARQRYGLTGGGMKPHPSTQAAERVGLLNAKSAPADLEAFHKGYQNIPGVLRGLKNDPVDVLRSGWRRGGTLGKVFTGIGAVDAGKSLIEKPEEGGPGRFEKALGSAGGTLGYLVAPTGLAPSLAMGGAAGVLGSKAGRLIDRMTGHKRQPAPQPVEGAAY
jgi:hypothetical protein